MIYALQSLHLRTVCYIVCLGYWWVPVRLPQIPLLGQVCFGKWRHLAWGLLPGWGMSTCFYEIYLVLNSFICLSFTLLSTYMYEVYRPQARWRHFPKQTGPSRGIWSNRTDTHQYSRHTISQIVLKCRLCKAYIISLYLMGQFTY